MSKMWCSNSRKRWNGGDMGIMGNIKNRYIKRIAEDLFSLNEDKITDNFYLNKIVVTELLDTDKHTINLIAGYLVRLHNNSKKNFEPVRKSF